MDSLARPLAFLLLLVSGWVNPQQQAGIDYLLEETLGGLVRYEVFFVMKLKTRAVEIAGITRHPNEMWMTQLARNLLDAGDGFLRDVLPHS